MPILVAGGTGFIGRHLVRRLVEAGAEVTVYTRDRERGRRRLGPGVGLCDTLEGVAAATPRAVVNLAGEGIADWPWTVARRRALVASRVGFTQALCATLAAAPPEVMINASAIGFYGVDPERTFTEEDGPGSGFSAALCERWEATARESAPEGCRVVCLRIGLVLGPGGMLERMRGPFSLGLGGRIGDGKQWMSWVHLEDVLGLIERALVDDAFEGPVNATAPEPITNIEFTRTLGRVLKRPTFFPVPALLLRTLLGDMAEEILLAGPRVRPARAQQAGYQFQHLVLEDALRDALGKEPAQPGQAEEE